MTDQERIQFLANELERVSCELKETKRRLWDEKDKVEKLQQSCADLGAEIAIRDSEIARLRAYLLSLDRQLHYKDNE